MPNVSPKLRDFAEHYTAASCSEDPASVAALYSPEGSFTANDSAPAIGRQAITELARSFVEAFLDLRVLMDDVLVRDNHAEYRWTLIGTNTGRQRQSGAHQCYEEWTIGAGGLIASSPGPLR